MLYAGDSPAGVCAERFFRGMDRVLWTSSMLQPLNDGRRPVLAWYEIPGGIAVCDLGDPAELLRRQLRPAQIVTRDYEVSRAWARSIFSERHYAGVSWWSYCDARWTTYGLWDRSQVRHWGIEELNVEHPAIVEAAAVMGLELR